MVKNDICIWGASKQNVLFSKNVPQKCTPKMYPMFRIGPVHCVQDLNQDFAIEVVSHQLGVSKNRVFGAYLGAKVLT